MKLDPTSKGTLEGETAFWVNPDAEVTIPADDPTAIKETEPFTRWDQPLTGTFTQETVIHAQYGNTVYVDPETGIDGTGVLILIALGFVFIAGCAAYWLHETQTKGHEE